MALKPMTWLNSHRPEYSVVKTLCDTQSAQANIFLLPWESQDLFHLQTAGKLTIQMK